MRLSLVIVLWLAFGSSALDAQNSGTDAIAWGAPFKLKNGLELVKISDNGTEPILIIRDNFTGALYMSVFEKGTLFPSEPQLAVEVNNNSQLLGFSPYKDGLIAFTADWIGNSDSAKISLSSVPAKDPSSQTKQLLASINAGNRKNIGKFFWDLASDNSQILFCHYPSFDQNKKAELHCTVIDRNLKNALQESVPLPYPSDDFELMGCAMDQNGILYFAGKVGVKLNSPFIRKYVLLTFDSKARKVREFSLSPDGLFIQEILLKPTDDALILVALYTNEPFENQLSTGYIHVKIGKKGTQVVERQVIPFADQLIVANQRKKDDRALSGIENINLRSIVEVGGSWLVFLEQQYIEQVCTTDPRTGLISCTDHHNYRGITALSLTEQWQTYIDKNQVSFGSESDFASQLIGPLPNGAVVIYNEHHKNQEEEEEDERTMTNASRSVIEAAILSENGNIRKVALTQERPTGPVFTPRDFSVLNNGDYLILAKTSREISVGLLDISQLD